MPIGTVCAHASEFVSASELPQHTHTSVGVCPVVTREPASMAASDVILETPVLPTTGKGVAVTTTVPPPVKPARPLAGV